MKKHLDVGGIKYGCADTYANALFITPWHLGDDRRVVCCLQDAFAYFDTDHDGIVTTKLLGPLLRRCGENPSEAEIQVKGTKV